MDHSIQLMFAYLGDVIYNPEKASLDVDALDAPYKELGEGLLYWGSALIEARHLARALSLGNLDVALPPPANVLAAPLKNLHASLKHLTWQTQQVAKGDYKQRVDFLGEFSSAFNQMTAQLDQRQKALFEEIEKDKAKTEALAQSNAIFKALAADLPQMIVIMDIETLTCVYMNNIAEIRLAESLLSGGESTQWIIEHVRRQSESSSKSTFEINVEMDGGTYYFSVSTYPLNWYQRSAIAYLILDVSKEMLQMQRLENVAFTDMLTGTYSRFYGMEQLTALMSAKQPLTVCFIDLDGLKYVNDTFGHAEGDRYIISVVEKLSSFNNGILCRLGGDEFMLIVPNAGHDEVLAVMENFRKVLIRESTGKYKHSISYGVVEALPEDGYTVSDVLSLADERMYAFKRKHKKQRSKPQRPKEM